MVGKKPYVRPDRRHDDAIAFVAEPIDGPPHTDDDLAENLAEAFVIGATSGESASDDLTDVTAPEEVGGPFIQTGPEEEMSEPSDEEAPEEGEKEPLPRTSAEAPKPPGL